MKVLVPTIVLVLLTLTSARPQQVVDMKITATAAAQCHIEPGGSGEEPAAHFAFGLVETGKLVAIRWPIKNRGGAVCIAGNVTIEPSPAQEINYVIPSSLQPTSYDDVVVMYETDEAGSTEHVLSVEFYTARLVSLMKDLATTDFVSVTIPDGSIVSAWGPNHYVAEGSTITYTWSQGYQLPYPVFQHWEISGVEGLSQSTDNPITLTAGVNDIVITPVVTVPDGE